MKAAFHDIGACLDARFGIVEQDVTAGGSGDATEFDGAYIDVTDRKSIKVLVPFSATLAAGETLSIAANLQDATALAGTGVADFGTALAATVVATGASGGSTETGVAELDFDVSQSRGFVRAQVTPDMSAASIDTANLSVLYVTGGAERNPISNSAV